ncbi:unnamed protein product [Amoebophrya sp. A120]|nr:unnamed protein product [Amoebophrya sp. A120]|eukprot:GSA120T00019025001.1
MPNYYYDHDFEYKSKCLRVGEDLHTTEEEPPQKLPASGVKNKVEGFQNTNTRTRRSRSSPARCFNPNDPFDKLLFFDDDLHLLFDPAAVDAENRESLLTNDTVEDYVSSPARAHSLPLSTFNPNNPFDKLLFDEDFCDIAALHKKNRDSLRFPWSPSSNPIPRRDESSPFNPNNPCHALGIDAEMMAPLEQFEVPLSRGEHEQDAEQALTPGSSQFSYPEMNFSRTSTEDVGVVQEERESDHSCERNPSATSRVNKNNNMLNNVTTEQDESSETIAHKDQDKYVNETSACSTQTQTPTQHQEINQSSDVNVNVTPRRVDEAVPDPEQAQVVQDDEKLSPQSELPTLPSVLLDYKASHPENKLPLPALTNVRKILERLHGNPQQEALHRMRRDVLIRVCHGEQALQQALSVFEFCDFEFVKPDATSPQLLSGPRNGAGQNTSEKMQILEWKGAEAVLSETRQKDALLAPLTTVLLDERVGADFQMQKKKAVECLEKIQLVIQRIRLLELQARDPDSLSFNEVIDAVRGNVELPGIAKIEEDNDDSETVAAPTESAFRTGRPKKPWEV